MRIVFRQCRVCPRDNGCEFRSSVKEGLTDCAKGMTALISCPEYRRLFSVGTLVEFEVHDMSKVEYEEGYEIPVMPYYRAKGETVKGRITGLIRGHKLYQIKLNKPITLNRLVDGQLQMVKLEFYTKPANQIRPL